MSLLEIGIDESDDFACLFVCYNTGVSYTTQAGGKECCHPSVEGFFIPLPRFPVFDDCSYGCWDLNDSLELRKKLAVDLDKLLKSYRFPVIITDLSFDYDRIDELMEGWWPVELKITETSGKFKGYIHTKNCD